MRDYSIFLAGFLIGSAALLNVGVLFFLTLRSVRAFARSNSTHSGTSISSMSLSLLP